MAAKRYRITVGYDGSRRSLFSVSEDKEGGLQIFNRASGALETGDGWFDVKARHTSVHPSKKSRGILVKHSAETKCGKKQVVTAFIEDADEHLCWIISSHRAFLMSLQAKEADKIQRDEEVFLIDFDPQNASLVYQLWVVKSDDEFCYSGSGQYSSCRIRFEIFSLIVLYGFINVPTYPEGSWSTAMTLRGDPSFGENKVDIQAKSLRGADAEAACHMHTVFSIYDLQSRLECNNIDIRNPAIEILMKRVSPLPLKSPAGIMRDYLVAVESSVSVEDRSVWNKLMNIWRHRRFGYGWFVHQGDVGRFC